MVEKGGYPPRENGVEGDMSFRLLNTEEKAVEGEEGVLTRKEWRAWD